MCPGDVFSSLINRCHCGFLQFSSESSDNFGQSSAGVFLFFKRLLIIFGKTNLIPGSLKHNI